MPATLVAEHVAPAAAAAAAAVAVAVSVKDLSNACPDCDGTLVTLDEDGSLTGFVGALTPCYCTNSSQG
ncbi:hypothetical protein ABZ800_35670, partial [Streptomyces sp. NPDC047813]|uniref:hypothetical protein n=1 Tax=Streptomyces sp. NPDC047813 TaxID=3154608 RepID=UPI0033CF78DF